MSKAWFKPKRYGYGAGLPITWEGWALLAVYTASTVGAVWYFRPPAFPFYVGILAATVLSVALVIVSRRKTDGEWRWRNGED
ncbi:hypothetical protein [Caulobacter sp. NIBR2454]|uniref:hypothetical protein n=1 Tax=Caulobacter sp. NIBR2454 TaxID=3015996 RepID=UPI0022B6D486|nr:hypothetical protein [Caulobacter sp. NIBR2454]